MSNFKLCANLSELSTLTYVPLIYIGSTTLSNFVVTLSKFANIFVSMNNKYQVARVGSSALIWI